MGEPTLPGLFPMPDGRLPTLPGRCPMPAGPQLTPETTFLQTDLKTLCKSTSSKTPVIVCFSTALTCSTLLSELGLINCLKYILLPPQKKKKKKKKKKSTCVDTTA